jgi:hypothetical protein
MTRSDLRAREPLGRDRVDDGLRHRRRIVAIASRLSIALNATGPKGPSCA